MNAATNNSIQEFKGYTSNAWIGKNHPRDRYLPVKEVAQHLRDYIKGENDLNACKWSISTKSYSGGQSITVALMQAPFEAITPQWKERHAASYRGMTPKECGHHQHGTSAAATTPEALRLFDKVQSFLNSWNRDDSDGMIDYFDRGFYDWYHVGKWDKPFKVAESKAVKKNRDGVDLPAVVPALANLEGVQLVEYSKKSFAIIGNTKQIKDALKDLGGRFNPKLTCGAGWIFSNSKRKKVRERLSI